MRAFVFLLILPTCLSAQVIIDRPVRFVGPENDRGIEGAAHPSGPTSAETVGRAALGATHWASSEGMSGDTLMLSSDPPSSSYRDGLFLRFLATSDDYGSLYLSLDGLPALAVQRSDGLDPRSGQIRAGAICEVMVMENVFVLLAPENRGCPTGTMQVNARLCIDSLDTPGMNFHEAQQYCAQAGGRLCSWDEYIGACVILQGLLVGMHNGWEWMDDTSDHTQTADQVGSLSCQSQRSIGPFSIADTRCCYRMQ